MSKSYDNENGVWRTIGGRRVFIRNGQSLADAMKESGKFSRVAKNQELYKKVDEENKKIDELVKKEEKKDEKKTIHTTSGDYTFEEMQKRDKEVKDLFKANWNNEISAKELNDKLDKMQEDGRLSYGERSSLQYDASREFDKELEQKSKVEEKSNWRDEIKKNNEQLEKDLEEYKSTHNMARESEGYYELFRENERKNAKIKQEQPDEPYEFVEAYAGYKAKREKLEPRTEDGGWKDATWTGKEYTNDEFMENLEDENWHTERRMLLDANLTNKQMEFVKDHTTFHNGSPSLDREITEELIKGAKGEKFRNPEDIISTRKSNEIEKLTKDLETASKGGTGGMTTDYRSLKERYKNLTGKEFDDSKVKIPYDPKKEYKDRAGNVINQDLMKDHLAGFTADEVKNRIESEKSFLMNYKPEDREINNAYIKEMEKYYNGMEKYNSRISDDFTTNDWKEGYGNQFGEGSWKGSKSDSGLYGKDKLKAIDDEIKKAYPEITTSRRTHQGGYTDSFSINVMSSTKPLVRDISDFSDSEINRLYNKGYNSNYYKDVNEFKKSLEQDLKRGNFEINKYNIDDDYRLTPFGKQLFKDINKVSNAYNYDESASQVDYYNTGHYINMAIGKYDKPFELKQESKINSSLRNKGYQKYIKEHPGSKMTLEDYLKKQK